MRLLLLSAVASLLACADDGDLIQAPAESVPKADRQSWDSTLLLQAPQSTVTVHLPYAQDFDERKLTLGEGGVSIEYSKKTAGVDSAAGPIRIRAARLVLDHDGGHIALAGSVAVETADSVVLASDTLTWSREDDLIDVPGWAQVESPQGSFRVRDLSATTALDRWSARNVTATVVGTTATGSRYELRVRAKRDTSTRRKGNLSVTYNTASIYVSGRTVTGDRALFDQEHERVSFYGDVVLEDSTRTIRAGRLEHDLGQGTSTASRSVTVEEQDWRLETEAIEVGASGQRWSSSGDPVFLTFGDRSLSAAHLAYDGRAGQTSFTASGGRGATRSEFRDGDRLIRADSLSYRRDVDRVEARGDVVLESPEFAGTATAQEAVLALDSEQAWLTGSPQLLRSRLAADDHLAIRAQRMEFDLAGHQMAGEGGFTVSAGSLVLKAPNGRYDSDSERLQLSAGVELAEGTADTIRADSMVVVLRDGDVVEAILPGALTGSIATSASQASWLEAGEGKLSFEDGSVRTMTLSGEARVTHRSFDRDAINRFTGKEIRMSFATDGQLARVIAEGDAQVISRLPDAETDEPAPAADPAVADGAGSVNRVRGSHLEITLEDGAVTEVRASESVEGEYVPSSTDAEPPNGD